MVVCRSCQHEFGRAKNEVVRNGVAPVADFFGVKSAKTTPIRTGFAKCPNCGTERAMWREYPEEMSGRQWLNKQDGRFLD